MAADTFRIYSDKLTAVVSAYGAELTSLRDNATGQEYIWQGRADVWTGHCYNIFPFAGRLNEDTYFLDGAAYRMPLHGFACRSMFRTVRAGAHELVFGLTDGEETRAQFPRKFAFTVAYFLTGSTLCVTYRAENRDERPMYCNFGAHPGIALPLVGGRAFGEHFLELPDGTKELLTDERKFRTGKEEGVARRLALSEEMFQGGAHILRTGGGKVRLGCKGFDRALSFGLEDFEYLVLWSKPGAPLICVEPWGSVSEEAGRYVPLEERADMLAVAPGKFAEKSWTMEVIG